MSVEERFQPISFSMPKFRLPLFVLAGLALTGLPGSIYSQPATRTVSSSLRKIQDVFIYKDERFYCAFPSIVRHRDGELLVAFRRAPERRALGERRTSHTDPNSYLVLVRSSDAGKT